MQFLFVALMSVLVGASALPHVLQAPNRPSFSMRKNTAFSLVSIPKFIKKVANLERRIASVDSIGIDTGTEGRALEREEKKKDTNQVEVGKAEGVVSVVEAVAPKPRGTIELENLELRACVCKDKTNMTCQVWIQGTCSHQDEYVSVIVSMDDGNESNRHFRCKEAYKFAGGLNVDGSQGGLVKITYMDQNLEQAINFINDCGFLHRIPQGDEEDY